MYHFINLASGIPQIQDKILTLKNNQLDNWQGWQCEAGATRLFIDKDFSTYGGECKNDYLGSALDGFTILDTTICKKIRCTGCTDDLIVAKNLPS